ncbi:MAG: putative porin [Halioglobus sp.]
MKKIISIAVSAAALGSVAVEAHVPEAEWQQFKAEFAAMAERLNQLEAENAKLRDAGSDRVRVEDLNQSIVRLEQQNEASSWTEKVKWKGDFRYRYEDIEEDGKSDRDRNRIRARAALIASPSDTTEVGLGMASGGDDPVSTNQTLGGGGSTKDLRLDLAYFKWTGLENTYVTMGKFSNPFYRPQKSGLIWDGDFRPEGLALGWKGDILFATATYSFLESDSKEDDDVIWGGQIGASFDLGESMTLTAALKYLDIPTKGRRALDPDDPDFFGNSSIVVGGEDVYAVDYNLFNGSVDLSMRVADMPLSLYADYVQNEDADDLDTGYIAGIKLGKAKKKGSWQVQYQYQVLEADATLGLLTDSDFSGGGTDGEGHKFGVKYALDSKWSIGATYFDTSTGVDLGNDADYQRLMLDTAFSY